MMMNFQMDLFGFICLIHYVWLIVVCGWDGVWFVYRKFGVSSFSGYARELSSRSITFVFHVAFLFKILEEEICSITVRPHVSWRGEQSIHYKGMKISP